MKNGDATSIYAEQGSNMSEDYKIGPPSIDYSIINELKGLCEDSDGSGMANLIQIFIQETEIRINELDTFLAKKDSKKVSNLTHAIKSGCASMGISHMAHIAGSMEHLSKTSNFNNLDDLFQLLKEEFAKVKLELINIKNN